MTEIFVRIRIQIFVEVIELQELRCITLMNDKCAENFIFFHKKEKLHVLLNYIVYMYWRTLSTFLAFSCLS